ncbi:hypothetical protein [Fusibacter sp. JL216-2]|uniref:hypothetical protein n=1 Tax=Fusibacter sp. JL216-2 TaxID=3071453 RepID=UPI003D329F23
MTNKHVVAIKLVCIMMFLSFLASPQSYADTTYSVEYGNLITSFIPETSGQIDIETTVSGIKNEITNFDFSDSAAGWSTPYGHGEVVNEQYIQMYSRLHLASRYQYNDINSKVGNKYFAYGNIYTLYPNTTYFRYGDTSSAVIGLENDWTEVYGSIDSQNVEPFRLYHRTDTSYDIGDQVLLKPDVVVIDKTKYGIEHLSEEQLLNIARSGITNRTGKNELKVQIRGKNLININGEISKSAHPDYKDPPQNYVVAGKLHAPAGVKSHLGRGIYVDLKPNTEYTFSYSTEGDAYTWIADAQNLTFRNRWSKNITFRRDIDHGNYALSFTSPSSGRIFISFLRNGDSSIENPALFWNLQLEEGTVKTTYMPYKSSTATYKMDVDNNEKIYTVDGLIYSSLTNKPIIGLIPPKTFAGERNTVNVTMNGSVLAKTNVTVRDFPKISNMTQGEVNSRILFELEEQKRKMDQMTYYMQEIIRSGGTGNSGVNNLSFTYDENGNLKDITKINE